MYLEKVDKPFVDIGVVTVTTERRQNLEDILPETQARSCYFRG